MTMSMNARHLFLLAMATLPVPTLTVRSHVRVMAGFQAADSAALTLMSVWAEITIATQRRSATIWTVHMNARAWLVTVAMVPCAMT